MLGLEAVFIEDLSPNVQTQLVKRGACWDWLGPFWVPRPARLSGQEWRCAVPRQLQMRVDGCKERRVLEVMGISWRLPASSLRVYVLRTSQSSFCGR